MQKTFHYFYITLSILGIGVASYLWWFQVTPNIIPCTISGCSHVLDHSSSYIFGVPVSTYGTFFYIALLYASISRLINKTKFTELSFLALIISGMIFSLYLRFLEFFVIHSICAWCWVSFIIISLIAILYIIERLKHKND